MQDAENEILVWLPSPMGDAVLCTPALRAIRNRFNSSRITFLAKAVVRQVLEPCDFNDVWLELDDSTFFGIAAKLKAGKFTHAILFKNSFASALATALARIPSRIGYARGGRSFLLTDKLYPPKLANRKFQPRSMLDYYLDIASSLGAETTDRRLELHIEPKDTENFKTMLPEVADSEGTIVVLVPGGAFGPSKCWPAGNFAETAARLITEHNATVVICAAPNRLEEQIAAEICASTTSSLEAKQSNLNHKLINLARKPLNLGELKPLFRAADLVITNDTGPRHIAIALGRKVVTLFGPNDPAWTQTDYENEIQIIGNVPCAPCTKPKCPKSEHLCMQSITVETVWRAAEELLQGRRSRADIFTRPEFEETSESFFVAPAYKAALAGTGLTSVDSVFSFDKAKNLTKSNLASFRSRLQFEIDSPDSTSPIIVFLKRYDNPPILFQLKNWLAHKSRKTCAACEFEPTNELPAAGINTPRAISYGEQWGAFFEKKSFIITKKIPDAEALERKLPHCFDAPGTSENLKLRRNFIAKLGAFVKRFHATDYRHRDLYFSHIFYSGSGVFHLIDLARAFKPAVLDRRFLVKDIAQVYYSAPGKYFSRSDRLRFYFAYTGRDKLTAKDKAFIRKVIDKTKWMARHDRKHGRPVPFAQ